MVLLYILTHRSFDLDKVFLNKGAGTPDKNQISISRESLLVQGFVALLARKSVAAECFQAHASDFKSMTCLDSNVIYV